MPLPPRKGLGNLLSELSGTQGGIIPQGGGPSQSEAVGGIDPTPVGASGAGTTAELGNQELQGLPGAQGMPAQAEPTPEDAEAQQMMEALENPQTPPEMRQQIQAQLEMAARRNLALGGQS